MRNSLLAFVILAIGLLLLASPFLVQVTSSQGVYDPWCDQDSDGDIDIFDIVPAAAAYGTTGDPAKDVIVTNWPRSSDVPVWYRYPLASDDSVLCPKQSTDGYSTLHVLVRVANLTGEETVQFWVFAPLWNASRTSFYPISVYEYTFASGDFQAAISLDVPSAEFYFGFFSAVGTTCTVSLSYYLTWA
jgi:hypothetical protein